jgi:hypothetical protein
MGLSAFRKDLKSGMSIDEALKKYDLSLEEALNEGSKKVKPSKYCGHIGLIKWSGHYFISKRIDKKNVFFGTYKTKKEAEIVREELHNCNWDKEKLPAILEKTGIKRVKQTDRKITPTTYIFKNPFGNFFIQKVKRIDGVPTRINAGTYSTIEEARLVRDELIKNDWEVSNLDEICKQLNVKEHKAGGQRWI